MLLSCLADFVNQPWGEEGEEGSVISVSSPGMFLLRLAKTFSLVCSLCVSPIACAPTLSVLSNELCFELFCDVYRDW